MTNWQRRRKKGMCGRCGKTPLPGKAVCAACFKWRQQHFKERYAKRRKKGLCTKCGVVRTKKNRCPSCMKEQNKITKEYRQRLRMEVYDAYGGAKCSCKGCPEHKRPHLSFLTIDHIASDGAEHRRKLGTTSSTVTFLWLKKNGFPEGFRVLCWNCQWGVLLNNGKCPHSERK